MRRHDRAGRDDWLRNLRLTEPPEAAAAVATADPAACARYVILRGVSVRVLFWSERYWPHVGGAEAFARDAISALTARGHSFSVVTSMTSEAAAAEDVSTMCPSRRRAARPGLQRPRDRGDA
jgi:hypothetical protein